MFSWCKQVANIVECRPWSDAAESSDLSLHCLLRPVFLSTGYKCTCYCLPASVVLTNVAKMTTPHNKQWDTVLDVRPIRSTIISSQPGTDEKWIRLGWLVLVIWWFFAICCSKTWYTKGTQQNSLADASLIGDAFFGRWCIVWLVMHSLPWWHILCWVMQF